MTGAEDVIRRLVARLGDAADFHFARKYVDYIVEEYAGKLATLGATDANPTQAESSGTCHITDNGPWGYPYVCSACGASFDPDVNNGEFNYCPNCGRRCVG